MKELNPEINIDFIEEKEENLNENNNNNNNLIENDEENNEISKLINEISLKISIKMIKTQIFDKRLKGIKTLNEYIRENENNINNINDLIVLLKENNILQEIYNNNTHNQIIKNSNTILEILFKFDKIDNNDIIILINNINQNFEAKNYIINILKNLIDLMKKNQITMILDNFYKTKNVNNNNENEKNSIESKNEELSEIEIDLMIKLINKIIINYYDENEIKKFIIFFKNYLKVYFNKNTINNILNLKDKIIFEELFLQCKNDLKENCNENTFIILQKIFEFTNLFKDFFDEIKKNNDIINLYENNFKMFVNNFNKNNNNNNENKNFYEENIKIRLDFLIKLIELNPDYKFIIFLKEILLNCDFFKEENENLFFIFIKNYINKNLPNKIEIEKEFFNIFNNYNENII